MKIIAKSEKEDLAVVYIGEFRNGRRIECVESLQPPFSRRKKWVLIISVMYGCPVQCRFCDAGYYYRGPVSKDDMLEQIDYLVSTRYPDKQVETDKFKIQFARMGEPALNTAVLDVLEELPHRYRVPGLMPTVSTIAPRSCKDFFTRLLDIKKTLYSERFQLQFSLHTTDPERRSWLIPVRTLSFAEIAAYGKRFYQGQGRKITLNFALDNQSELDPGVLLNYFSPETYLIKITPVNPTYSARDNNLRTSERITGTCEHIRAHGYDVILSIGEMEENKIGSNCGQYIQKKLTQQTQLQDSYTYQLQELREEEHRFSC